MPVSSDSDHRPASPHADSHARPLHARARILLADDDDELRMLMHTFLREAGYDVLACNSTAQALEMARRNPRFDLLLADIRMPGASGLELARVWCETHPHCPVVIISGAMLRDEDLNRMVDGGWHFVPKPFTVPRLLTVIARALHAAAGPVATTSAPV